MMQSSGPQRSTGIRSSIALTVLGTMPTKDGMPPVFSARQLHSASSSTVVKSFDSRTTVENAVRSNAAADSSAIEIRRDHRISRVTGSNRRFGVAFTAVSIQIRVAGMRSSGTGRDHGRRAVSTPIVGQGVPGAAGAPRSAVRGAASRRGRHRGRNHRVFHRAAPGARRQAGGPARSTRTRLGIIGPSLWQRGPGLEAWRRQAPANLRPGARRPPQCCARRRTGNGPRPARGISHRRTLSRRRLATGRAYAASRGRAEAASRTDLPKAAPVCPGTMPARRPIWSEAPSIAAACRIRARWPSTR